MSRLMFAAALAGALLLSPLAPRVALAQSDSPMVQSTVYFGLESPDGGVSEQQWATFVADEIAPRFPDGLTVLSAYGQGASTKPLPMLGETTKVLILVHPDTPEAAEKLGTLKALYKERFAETGVFHTRQPIEIVTD
ncbi:DUF3574 domain-containing protein [Amorphus coralli]|uniref:DUF3574 domain-containing protein n=1 Tax=Amorphus coralli TaxID=340680 RepID=UPI0006861F92|nr:DUF3574 domain-containing protein [Amorphus coralli]